MHRLTWIEIALLGGGMLTALLVVGIYFGTFGAGSPGVSHDPEKWAQFGEYVGGSLGASFGFLAYLGVLVTLRSQRAQSDLDEIQRLIGKTSDRIDQILHSQPLQMDPLRHERGDQTTTFDDLQSLTSIAIVESFIPEAEERARRVELYLGKDVLTDPISGDLVPVQWRGYIVAVGQYQGEVLKKKAVQERFQDKLRGVAEGGSTTISCDWEGIRLILKRIFAALHQEDAKAIKHAIRWQYEEGYSRA